MWRSEETWSDDPRRYYLRRQICVKLHNYLPDPHRASRMLTASMSTGTSSVISAHFRCSGGAELPPLPPVAPAACLAASTTPAQQYSDALQYGSSPGHQSCKTQCSTKTRASQGQRPCKACSGQVPCRTAGYVLSGLSDLPSAPALPLASLPSSSPPFLPSPSPG